MLLPPDNVVNPQRIISPGRCFTTLFMPPFQRGAHGTISRSHSATSLRSPRPNGPKGSPFSPHTILRTLTRPTGPYLTSRNTNSSGHEAQNSSTPFANGKVVDPQLAGVSLLLSPLGGATNSRDGLNPSLRPISPPLPRPKWVNKRAQMPETSQNLASQIHGLPQKIRWALQNFKANWERGPPLQTQSVDPTHP